MLLVRSSFVAKSRVVLISVPLPPYVSPAARLAMSTPWVRRDVARSSLQTSLKKLERQLGETVATQRPTAATFAYGANLTDLAQPLGHLVKIFEKEDEPRRGPKASRTPEDEAHAAQQRRAVRAE